MIKNDFEEKRLVLETAKKNLKKHFVGIDHIIDDVISKMTAWYLFPDIQTRPLIINLWGLTGVGKTDLIRKLVKEIGFADRFMEIQMTNKGDVGWDRTMCGKLLGSDLEPHAPGVLLLDEIQRFRTVDQNGNEIDDYNFQDIWMLLSDGKFGGGADVKGKLVEYMMDIAYSKDIEQSEPDDSEDEDEGLVAAEFDSNGNIKRVRKTKKKKAQQKPRKYNMSYWQAKRIHRLLRTNDPIEKIMTWTQSKIMREMEKAIYSDTAYKETDYSQLLIFISGNLDEAFRNAVNVSDADRDADEVFNRTSKINMITVKDALVYRFKPEQISRFGNIHVIYPSLNKKSFMKIIARKLSSIKKNVKHKSGINIDFDKSIQQNMYDNGVFPVQGVRPLLSTMDDFTNRFIPHAIIEALDKGATSVNFGVDGKFVVSKILVNGKEYKTSYDYEGILDEIRNQRKEQTDVVSSIAVHEAGHALVYTHLFGLAPSQLIVNTTSNKSGGVTFMHDMDFNKEDLLDVTTVALGGMCAEELVYGPEKMSDGCGSDMDYATGTIARMIRYTGHYFSEGYSARVIPQNYDGSPNYDTDIGKANDKIRSILLEKKNECKEIISKYPGLFKDICIRLKNDHHILPEEYAKLCKKHGVDCEVVSTDDTVCYSYEEDFNEYFEQNNN